MFQVAAEEWAALRSQFATLDAAGGGRGHDTFSRNTRNQLRQVFYALRELMTPPDPPKRPIGFVTHEDKGKKAQGSARSKT